MPDTVSAVLSLPFIQPNQAQKHVTHNTALRVLDGIIQLAVIARDLDSPPVAEVGARYIVGAGASGDWAGQAGAVAIREEGGWSFVAPLPGWLAFVTSEGVAVVYDAMLGWDTLTGGPDLEAETLGLNTSADATNRLAVAAGATLLTHDGTGHQLKINKATDTDTASLLFQSGFTGHAEMGLAGSADFSVKVSADGSTWAEALRVDAATAVPHMPQGLLVNGTISGDGVGVLQLCRHRSRQPRRHGRRGDRGALFQPVDQPVGFCRQPDIHVVALDQGQRRDLVGVVADLYHGQSGGHGQRGRGHTDGGGDRTRQHRDGRLRTLCRWHPDLHAH